MVASSPLRITDVIIYICPYFATHKCGVHCNYPDDRWVKTSEVIWVDECCIMFYTNIAGYAKNTISRDWLVEKVFAALDNEFKECGLPNLKDFMNREFNWEIMWFYTDIAGFTTMMMSATVSVHYDI